jgi:O-antigen/teichoic acid export membrane protein
MANKELLKSNIIQGFSTLIIREFFLKFFSIFGQIFLARLLSPADFGLYVILIFIINFFNIFSDFGLSVALIQKKNKPTKQELSNIFYLKLLIGFILISLIFIASPFVHLYYPSFNQENVLMLRLLSLIIILTSLRVIPTSLLERDLKYNLISIVDIVGVVGYYIAGVTLSFLSFGLWALVFATLFKELIETLILYFVKPFLPNIITSFKNIRGLLKFGAYIQGNGIVNFVKGSVTPVIAGRLTGPYSVGLLDFAFNLSLLPETIAVNFGRVAFAGYSRIQTEKKILLNSMSKSISMLAIILYIFPIIIFVYGNQIIPIIFSDKWLPSLNSLYWFSAASFVLPIIAPLGQGILAIGKSKEIFWGTLFTVILGWILSFVLIKPMGFSGIAASYLITNTILALTYIYILNKIGYSFAFPKLLLNKLFVVFSTLVLSFALESILPHTSLALFFKLSLSTLIYFLCLLVFVRDETLELLQLIFQVFKK